MASMGRQLTRSVVCHIRQPRWNRLLLKSNMNLHLLSIYQQKRFSRKCDDGEKQKKSCTDYKKNPCIEGHQPTEMPCLEPANPQIRITRRRKFLQKKKCKDLENDSPCASYSICTFLEAKRKVRISVSWDKVKGCLLHLSQLRIPHLDPASLNQERTFCKNVQKETCSVAVPSPKPPVPPERNRVTRKRMHLLAMKQKEAEAKGSPKTQEPCDQTPDQALDKLKQASMLNSKIKECKTKQFNALSEVLKISKDDDKKTPTDNILKCMLAGLRKACALHAEQRDRYAKAIGIEEVAKLQLEKWDGETIDMSLAKKMMAQEAAELQRLLRLVKEKFKLKREELEAEKAKQKR